jgi:hypothetical protein
MTACHDHYPFYPAALVRLFEGTLRHGRKMWLSRRRISFNLIVKPRRGAFDNQTGAERWPEHLDACLRRYPG